MKYVLIFFSKQEKTIADIICKEIQRISVRNSVKYCYSNANIIFTFSSIDNVEHILEFFGSIFSEVRIPFFITSYVPDKMSFWFGNDAEKHLFGTDKRVQEEDYTDEDEIEVQNLMSKSDEAFEQALTEGYSEAEKFLNKSAEPTPPRLKKYMPTLDELLDKINASGMGSLTTKEKELLTNYSK